MNRELRIGIMGDRQFGAGYMRDVERRAKRLRAAAAHKVRPTYRQLRLPLF